MELRKESVELPENPEPEIERIKVGSSSPEYSVDVYASFIHTFIGYHHKKICKVIVESKKINFNFSNVSNNVFISNEHSSNIQRIYNPQHKETI